MQQIQPIEPDEQIPVWDYTIALGPVDSDLFDGGDGDGGRPTPDPIEFRVRVTYRERQDSWYLDLFEPVENVIAGFTFDEDRPIITGFRLCAGFFNSMFRYQIPELPGFQFFMALDIDGTDTDPGFEALGRSHALIHTDQVGLVVTAFEEAIDLGVVDELNIDFDEERPASIVILP